MRSLVVLCGIGISGLLLMQSCKPAEANCNHPNHEKYIRSQTQKKMGKLQK
ncbi:MAG: hypothetical protein KF690_09075 [Bacteroidetes bacterium]|nr:hypothetical protein [Bacteroidota bacterium]